MDSYITFEIYNDFLFENSQMFLKTLYKNVSIIHSKIHSRVFTLHLQMRTLLLLAVLGVLACSLTADAFAVWRNSMHKRGRVKDPNWIPCLHICMNACNIFEDFHLKYCATECIKTADYSGLGSFYPQDYCFDLSQ